MTEAELTLQIKAAVNDADLAEREIPAIDLYLDQILSLVADKNKCASLRHRERELTKTMVNNYSKDGLISPITGKKYTKEQIVEILLVYAMKQSLSIGEIKRVLKGAREECGLTGERLTEGYSRFLTVKEKNRARTGNVVRTLLREDGLSIENDDDFFVALLDVLSLSAYLKVVAQEMLEARYSDPDLAEKEAHLREKSEKKARSEAEKAAKKELAEREKEREKADRAEKKSAERAQKKEKKAAE